MSHNICFEDLCGTRLFSGCELTREKVGITNYWGETETRGVCLFTIDGVTYKAVEDPCDGYRSYCEHLEISEQKPRYSFPAVKVFCSMLGDDEYGHNDVLVVRDAKNGKVILKVGTKCVYDYYPYCLFDYTPENMSCNEV